MQGSSRCCHCFNICQPNTGMQHYIPTQVSWRLLKPANHTLLLSPAPPRQPPSYPHHRCMCCMQFSRNEDFGVYPKARVRHYQTRVKLMTCCHNLPEYVLFRRKITGSCLKRDVQQCLSLPHCITQVCIAFIKRPRHQAHMCIKFATTLCHMHMYDIPANLRCMLIKSENKN